jgi:hypothetical protein
MSQYYHDPWEDGVTQWKEADMNAPLAQLDQAIYDLSVGASSEPSTAYIIAVYWPGTPSADEVLLMHVFSPVAVEFASGMLGCKAKALDAATAQTVFSIKLNDVEVATCTFAAAGTVGAFAASTNFTCEEDDILKIVSPNPMDATLGRIAMTLKGSKDIATTTTTTAPPEPTTTTAPPSETTTTTTA